MLRLNVGIRYCFYRSLAAYGYIWTSCFPLACTPQSITHCRSEQSGQLGELETGRRRWSSIWVSQTTRPRFALVPRNIQTERL
jgi:hypothetical protein